MIDRRSIRRRLGWLVRRRAARIAAAARYALVVAQCPTWPGTCTSTGLFQVRARFGTALAYAAERLIWRRYARPMQRVQDHGAYVEALYRDAYESLRVPEHMLRRYENHATKLRRYEPRNQLRPSHR